MSWEPSEAFYEWVRKNRASAAEEYVQVAQPQICVSEENLSAISRLRYMADKIAKGESVDHEIGYLLRSKLIRDWEDKQPKPGRTGWGNR